MTPPRVPIARLLRGEPEIELRSSIEAIDLDDEQIPELRAFDDQTLQHSGKIFVSLQSITSIYYEFGKHIGKAKLVEQFKLSVYELENWVPKDVNRYWIEVDAALQQPQLRAALRRSLSLPPRDVLVYDKSKLDGRDGVYYQALSLFSDLRKSTDPRVVEAVEASIKNIMELAQDVGCKNPIVPKDWVLCKYGISTNVLHRVSVSLLGDYKFARFQEFRGARLVEFPPTDPTEKPCTKLTAMRQAEDYLAQTTHRIGFIIRGVKDHRELCLVRKSQIVRDLATLATIPDNVISPVRWSEL
ncbi:hypothetical protein PHYSODRAFT_296121 [Phytophthora sojae]|uniref:Uncharacterized protein n=1 Tax=Phytophthora sojae (strain P6497) TaxID=1094619 RepID=G4YXJ1_PHYSP|nr:hypothetical protein PHYSODRAFT_296121 [Phytophthora sojae]EGZ23852.1 hypothetical protein PHYSODRAFT_296121 [Phytophthora sojae]|eukprot:XP_009519140.1 hypothetical protein PHYSODRAFT_296121 [Phytophthora sojae]